MIKLPEKVLDDIRAHSKNCYPRESCGVVIIYKGKPVYRPCKNVALGPTHFAIDPEDYANAEDMGTVVRIVHSHVGRPPLPSPDDLTQCERHGIPWLIVNYPLGTVYEFEPSGYKSPLFGRQWAHGTMDCYTFIQDYFKLIDIVLGDYERSEEWWTLKDGHGKPLSLYRDNFKKEGFVVLGDDQPAQVHDLFLMMHGAEVENHAAVLIRDNVIAHHPMDRLSTHEVYGGYWRHITSARLRHGSLL